MKSNFDLKTLVKEWPFLLLSLTGITFCFFIGYPFANHNESYLWSAVFNEMSFVESLTVNFFATTYRPLGQGIAWLGFKFSGGTSNSVQIFNFLLLLICEDFF